MGWYAGARSPVTKPSGGITEGTLGMMANNVMWMILVGVAPHDRQRANPRRVTNVPEIDTTLTHLDGPGWSLPHT